MCAAFFALQTQLGAWEICAPESSAVTKDTNWNGRARPRVAVINATQDEDVAIPHDETLGHRPHVSVGEHHTAVVPMVRYHAATHPRWDLEGVCVVAIVLQGQFAAIPLSVGEPTPTGPLLLHGAEVRPCPSNVVPPWFHKDGFVRRGICVD